MNERGKITYNNGQEWIMFKDEYYYPKGLQRGINTIFKIENNCNEELKECLSYFENRKDYVQNIIYIKLQRFTSEESINEFTMQGLKLINENNTIKMKDIDYNEFACTYIKNIVRNELLHLFKQKEAVKNCLFNNFLKQIAM
jgi:hypothetical protein